MSRRQESTATQERPFPVSSHDDEEMALASRGTRNKHGSHNEPFPSGKKPSHSAISPGNGNVIQNHWWYAKDQPHHDHKDPTTVSSHAPNFISAPPVKEEIAPEDTSVPGGVDFELGSTGWWNRGRHSPHFLTPDGTMIPVDTAGHQDPEPTRFKSTHPSREEFEHMKERLGGSGYHLVTKALQKHDILSIRNPGFADDNEGLSKREILHQWRQGLELSRPSASNLKPQTQLEPQKQFIRPLIADDDQQQLQKDYQQSEREFRNEMERQHKASLANQHQNQASSLRSLHQHQDQSPPSIRQMRYFDASDNTFTVANDRYPQRSLLEKVRSDIDQTSGHIKDAAEQGAQVIRDAADKTVQNVKDLTHGAALEAQSKMNQWAYSANQNANELQYGVADGIAELKKQTAQAGQEFREQVEQRLEGTPPRAVADTVREVGNQVNHDASSSVGWLTKAWNSATGYFIDATQQAAHERSRIAKESAETPLVPLLADGSYRPAANPSYYPGADPYHPIVTDSHKSRSGRPDSDQSRSARGSYDSYQSRSGSYDSYQSRSDRSDSYQSRSDRSDSDQSRSDRSDSYQPRPVRSDSAYHPQSLSKSVRDLTNQTVEMLDSVATESAPDRSKTSNQRSLKENAQQLVGKYEKDIVDNEYLPDEVKDVLLSAPDYVDVVTDATDGMGKVRKHAIDTSKAIVSGAIDQLTSQDEKSKK